MDLDKEVQQEMINEKKMTEDGVIDAVHISPVGDFIGSGLDGKPKAEHIDAGSLAALADQLNKSDDVLLDVDHESVKAEGRSTRAAGWLTKFFVDPVKGLFAKLHLTKWGKELVESREFRYISPVFMLDEEGRPSQMHSAAMTNTPAFAGYIEPILNEQPADQATDNLDNLDNLDNSGEISEMDIKEIKDKLTAELKAEVLAELKAELAEAKADEAVIAEAAVEEPADVAEVAVEQTEAKEAVEEPKAAELKDDIDDTKEVIVIEALNQAPAPTLTAEPERWRSLQGKEFVDWINNGMK